MADNYFLHINTAQQESYVFISDGSGVIMSYIDIPSLQQSALINVSIQHVIETSGLLPKSISAISVNNGPGSYTGLRVALATAKGLALGWQLPIILHNYLDLLAYRYKDERLFSVIIKARAEEYFMTVYKRDECVMKPAHVMKKDCTDFLEKNNIDLVYTDDPEELKNDFFKTVMLEAEVKESLSALTMRRFQEKQFDDLAYSEPFYLKPAYVTTAKNNILHKN